MFKLFFNKSDFIKNVEKILYMKNIQEKEKDTIIKTMEKVERNYNSYMIVTQEVMKKNEFQNRMLNLLKDIQEFEIIENGYAPNVDLEKSKIQFNSNSISCMHALMKYEPRYFTIKKSPYSKIFQRMVKNGSIENEVELVRDFDELSWKKHKSKIATPSEIILTFNMQWLHGKDEFRKARLSQIEYDLREKSKEIIKEKLKVENLDDYDMALDKLLYVSSTEEEKKQVYEEYENDIKTLKLMQNSKEFLNKTEEERKKLSNTVAKIDEILNNHELLFEAFAVKKKQLIAIDQEKYDIFDINIYRQILERDRKDCLDKIDKYLKMQSPDNFMKYKNILEKKVGFLITNNLKEDEVLRKFQKVVYDIIYSGIDNIPDEEILKHIYMIRYSRFNYFSEEKQGIDYTDIYQKSDKLLKALVEKGVKAGIINTFASDEASNLSILLPAFKSAIVDYHDIKLSIYNTNSILLRIYNENVLNNEFELLDIVPQSLNANSRKKVSIIKKNK